jgi:hypothetical protein
MLDGSGCTRENTGVVGGVCGAGWVLKDLTTSMCFTYLALFIGEHTKPSGFFSHLWRCVHRVLRLLQHGVRQCKHSNQSASPGVVPGTFSNCSLVVKCRLPCDQSLSPSLPIPGSRRTDSQPEHPYKLYGESPKTPQCYPQMGQNEKAHVHLPN